MKDNNKVNKKQKISKILLSIIIFIICFQFGYLIGYKTYNSIEHKRPTQSIENNNKYINSIN